MIGWLHGSGRSTNRTVLRKTVAIFDESNSEELTNLDGTWFIELLVV